MTRQATSVTEREEHWALRRFHWLVRELHGSAAPQSTVVIVPGLGSGEYLLAHARLLARSHRVLLPDMPGFGGTRATTRLRTVEEFAAALLELVDGSGDEPVDLIGNSFGTQVAVAAAQRAPQAVGRLVLIGPTFDVRARSTRAMLRRWLRNNPHEPPSLALSLARSYARCGLRTPWLAFSAGLADRPEERLREVAAPTLLVRGAKDSIAPGRWLTELANSCRGPAEIAEIDGAAHTADYSHPEAVAAHTVPFLARS